MRDQSTSKRRTRRKSDTTHATASLRESILREEGPVSKTLCSCSLGHTKVFWGDGSGYSAWGEVLKPVLGGASLCRFVIHLPDKVMEQYVDTVPILTVDYWFVCGAGALVARATKVILER